MKTKVITKEDTFAEAMKKNPQASKAFSDAGMHCCGCPYSTFESIEQGAEVHGINADVLVKNMNALQNSVTKKSSMKVKGKKNTKAGKQKIKKK